jgi:hypothetical protein
VVGAAFVFLGSYRFLAGVSGDPVANLLSIAGGFVFAGLGAMVARLFGRGGVARLRVDDHGLEFIALQGSVRTLAWSDARLQADLYDVSASPETNSFVRDNPVWRYGLIVRSPFLFQCRFPREAYDAILAGARGHGIRVEPSGWRNFTSDTIAFRIGRP